MSWVSKLQPVWIVLSALLGILLGQLDPVAAGAAGFIEIFLMLLLFVVFLSVDITEIAGSFSNFRFSVTALMMNFVWTPVFAFLLAKLFLGESVDLQVGFLMLMVTPCTDWYLIFTGMSGGNVPLGSSILPMNLILQILLLPVYLWLFVGGSVAFVPARMIASIMLVLVAPLTLANGVKWTMGRTGRREKLGNLLERWGDNIQLLFLCFAVIAMFASQGGMLMANPSLMARMLPPLLVFFALTFFVAMTVGKKMGMPFADRVSLLFTTSARNSPVSLAIAAIAFPDRPLISLALVIGPLIELPVLAVDSAIVRRMKQRQGRFKG